MARHARSGPDSTPPSGSRPASGDLVITEKNSQARDVRAAIGPRHGAILPAEGHLITLREPEEVNPDWKRWTATLLRPDGLYGTKPATGGNKASKLKAIREALRSARRVWLATDCDREGQLIGQEILEHCRFRGEVMRVMFTAQDPQTIRDAFARAKPNAEYRNLHAAAVARQQSDQIYNLSLTRTATVLLGRGERAVIGVGRVKTPTLAIVCRRELEIRAFRPQTYFEIVAIAHPGGDGDDRAEIATFPMRHAPAGKILKREDADAIVAKADGFSGPLSVKVEDKRQPPPRLHDLPTLQRLCGARFGWTAAHTLEVAQELYDGAGKKLITYPRAESRYLPESLIADAPGMVAALTAGKTFGGLPMPPRPIIRRGKTGHFWDKGLEGVSHHAIIPNANTVGELRAIWPRLSGDERRLFMIVVRCYLAALMADFRYRQTTATLDVSGHAFRAMGRQPLEMGWRAVYGDDVPDRGANRNEGAGEGRGDAGGDGGGDGHGGMSAVAEGRGAGGTGDRRGEGDDETQLLPPLRDGEATTLRDPKVETKETKPPPRYNEGTLIEAMANAWRFVDNPEHRERLKEAKGIGTPATRGEIISGLKRQDLLVASGKHVVPTERGLALFDILARADAALVDPAATAKLEFLLDEVLTGRRGAEEAIDAVCGHAARIIGRLRENAPSAGAALPAASVRKAAAPGGGKRPRRGKGEGGSGASSGAFHDVPLASGDGGPEDGIAAPRRKRAFPAGTGEAAKNARPAPKRTVRKRSVRAPSGAAQREGGADGGTRRFTKVGTNQASPGGEGTTPLRIPFGNKETAMLLGARYGAAGWFAPEGTNLEPFRDKGWVA